MFHTFSDFVGQSVAQGSDLREDTRSEPKINRSCMECRRRKIRCNGELPCGNCKWYKVEALTAISPENCPDDFIVVRDYMRNRHMDMRILLLRPVLLRHVENKTQFEDLTDNDKEVIANYQKVSLEAIRNIACCMRPNSFWVWGSTWYLYQSCLVPLMMLLAFPCQSELLPCHSEIEQARAAFKSFIPWNAAARRSYDVDESIYEASRNVTEFEASSGTLTALGEMDMEFWTLHRRL